MFPRPQILDPQGKAISEALARVGYDEVRSVRAGKTFDIEIEAADRAAAETRLAEVCDKLLANTIVEDFSFELEESS
ncbi:MAG: phosphoribosylformylglycinamidine synthase subunit PurS [Acidobacteriota bacterium]